MKNFFRAYRFLNILSVDVAAGAVVCALFFAKIFHVSILIFGAISLGLTVWIIYTADHLLDAYKTIRPASTERHRFHQRQFKLLLIFLILATLVDAVQLFFIRKVVFVEGIVLASVIVFYFLLHRQLKFFKEIIGAVLYCGGVLLIPISVKKDNLTNLQLILISQFAVTALINLLLFSWYDRQKDEQDKHESFATIMGESKTKKMLIALFFIQALLLCVQFSLHDLAAGLTLLVMNFFLLVIFTNRKYFENEDRYRLLGDFIFMLPVFYVLL